LQNCTASGLGSPQLTGRFLAALLHRLLRDVLRRVRLLVRPETVLRWHRNLIARRHAALSRPKRCRAPAHRPVDPGANLLPELPR